LKITPLKIVLSGLLAVVLAGAAVAGWYVWADHDRAPAVTFSTIDGHRISLADLRGRPVMVQFWADNCPTCRREMPQLAALYKDFHERGLELIAVAMPYDPPNLVLKTARDQDFPYPVALDPMGKVTAAFGHISLTPTSILVAPDGSIAEKHVGAVDFSRWRKQIENMLTTKPQATSNKPLVADNL